jgi:hypothetical protein
MLYGRRSEKVSAEQLSLMLEALGPEAPDAAREEIEEKSEPEQPTPPTPPNPDPKPPRLHKGRSALPEHLPRRQRIVAVPEAEGHCVRLPSSSATLATHAPIL